MAFLLVLLLSLVVASFFGHAVHWLIHQRWSGVFHRSHMDHHLEQYPPGDLLSMKYRSAKWYHSGPLLFLPGFVVVMSVVLAAMWACHAPTWSMATFAVTMLVFAAANDYFHDSFHIQDHWMLRFGWFKSLRRVHFEHHYNMKRNFGIFLFVWDKAFGTYVDR